MGQVTQTDLQNFKQEMIDELKRLINNQPQAIPEFLRSSQVKSLLGCSDSKLETMRKNGTISHSKVGGTIYYKSEDISKLFN